jgi:hypothetical protein
MESRGEDISRRIRTAGSRSGFIVLTKAGNWACQDPLEGREPSRVKTHWRETREGTLSPANLSTKRQWIADLARKYPERVLTSLHHLIDREWMLEAYRLTRKDGASTAWWERTMRRSWRPISMIS